jgi:hypothetical protein
MIAACRIGFVSGAATLELASGTLPNKMIRVQSEIF